MNGSSNYQVSHVARRFFAAEDESKCYLWHFCPASPFFFNQRFLAVSSHGNNFTAITVGIKPFK